MHGTSSELHFASIPIQCSENAPKFASSHLCAYRTTVVSVLCSYLHRDPPAARLRSLQSIKHHRTTSSKLDHRFIRRLSFRQLDKMQLQALPVEIISRICRFIGLEFENIPGQKRTVSYRLKDFQSLRITCKVRAAGYMLWTHLSSFMIQSGD